MDKTYLGDGLYAHDDGFHIVLSTQREDGVEHYVALDGTCVSELMRFIANVRGLEISVTKVSPQEEPKTWESDDVNEMSQGSNC